MVGTLTRFGATRTLICIAWLLITCLSNERHSQVSDTCPSGKHISTADIICAPYARPLVAIFILGTARTFAQPLLYRTIRTNLLEAFGGNITLFALLTPESGHGDQSIAYEAALKHLAVAAENGVHSKVVEHASDKPCGQGVGFDPTLVDRVMARKIAWEHLREFERGAGVRHDLIIYTRQDLAWLHAIQPYCFWDLSAPTRLWDWAWLLPSKRADEFFVAPYNYISHTCGELGNVSTWEEEARQLMYQMFPANEDIEKVLPVAASRIKIQGTSGMHHELRWEAEATFKNSCTTSIELVGATPLLKDLNAAKLLNCRRAPKVGKGKARNTA